jgi:hypothetical protein
MRFAADFAELLDIELLGLLVDDLAMLASAGFPFVREFRAAEGKWSRLEPERLVEEAGLAAAQIGRQLSEAARISKVRLSFEKFAGDEIRALSEVTRKDDIVLIPEPQLAQLTRTTVKQAESAFRAQASVLIVPRNIGVNPGPIIGIGRHPGERGLSAAVSIASAARADLLVVDVGDTHLTPADIAVPSGSEVLSVSTVRASQSCIEAGAVPVSDFGGPKERLIVTTRGVLDDALVVATGVKRAVPLLIANGD